jgi:hypothetical protein
VQLKHWKRGRTIYRELMARGMSADAARRVAANGRRWWHNSAMAFPHGVAQPLRQAGDGSLPHRLERALHADRADVDVREDQGDEQQGDDGVNASENIGDLEREQQQEPHTITAIPAARESQNASFSSALCVPSVR